MLSNRHAAVTSFTRTCPRKTAICGPQYRAPTSATARRGAVQRIVSCSAVVEAPGNTQTSGGSPPTKPPQQDKALGGGDDSGDKAAGWWQAAIRALLPAWPFILSVAALLASVVGVNTWFSGFATTAALEGAEKRITNNVNEKVAAVQKNVNEKVAAVQKSVDEAKQSVKDSEGRVQRSLERLTTATIVMAAAVVVLAVVGAFFAGRKK